MRMTIIASAAAAIVAGAGCLNSTGPDPSQRTSAVVTGQVTRPDGTTPVGGPAIIVQLLSAVSGGSATLLATGSVIGTDNGRFLILFLLTDPAQTGSATISVTPPPGTGLAPFDTSAIPVKIFKGESPAESTYVQLALRLR